MDKIKLIRKTKTFIHTVTKIVIFEKISKSTHGRYVKNPKCMFCNSDISHESLDGDYTLLLCTNSNCWMKLRGQHL